MSSKLENFLYQWPKPYIRDQDLQILFDQPSNRHDAVKYAIAKKILKPLRRGLYLIECPGKPINYDSFELALQIYGPSYISLESALSHHGWIPEAVYTVTSVTSRREKLFNTFAGQFRYSTVPKISFYFEVACVAEKNSAYLMAHPWKAIADYLYVYKKSWNSLKQMMTDLRIEKNKIEEYDNSVLANLAEHYKNNKVKNKLKIFLKELNGGNNKFPLKKIID